ncbi:MAG: oligosaccharide flippase family protein [Pseudomonadota bacterium]
MAWFFFPRLISAFIAILVLVILSRVLGPADFARYNITILFGTVGYSFVFAWLAIAIVRFHSSEKYSGRVIAYALHTSAKIAIFLIPIVAVGCFFAPSNYLAALVLGSVFAVAHTTQELGLAAFRVYRKGPAFAFITLMRPLVAVSLSVAFVLLGFGFVGAVIGAIAGALLAGGIALYKVFPKSGAEPASAQQIKEFLVFGVPLGIVTSGSMLIMLLSQSLIASFANLGAVGIFAAAQTLAVRSIAMPMLMASRASGAAIFSEYEESGMDAANVVLARHFSIVLLMSAPIATTLIFANEMAVLLMFGEVYQVVGAQHLQILSIAALIIGVQGSYFSYAFTLSRKTYGQLYILAAAIVFHGACTALALHLMGSIGASYAMLLTAIMSTAAYYFFGKRVSTDVALPIRPIWKIIVASVAMAPFAAYADGQASILVGIGLLFLGVFAYLVTLVLLRQTGILVVLAWLRNKMTKRRRQADRANP